MSKKFRKCYKCLDHYKRHTRIDVTKMLEDLPAAFDMIVKASHAAVEGFALTIIVIKREIAEMEKRWVGMYQ